MATWTNADGLQVRFPADKGEVVTQGTILNGTYKILEFKIDLLDLPLIAGGGDETVAHLPAHALIVDSYLVCNTAMYGTDPTLTIGLADDAGVAIDADGIDAAIAGTAQAAAGDVVLNDGALVDKTATIGAKRGWVYAATGGTVTAGVSTLYVTYFIPTV